MGFSSIDALVSAISASGQINRIPFVKTVNTGATTAAGRWHELLSVAGTGGGMTLTGTAGAGLVCTGATAGAIPVGPNVAAATRHLLGMSAWTPSALLVPSVLLLTDIIHIYPSLVVVTTPTTLTNHPTWTGTGDTRMTNANGVMASALLTTASSAAGQLTLTYLDQAGNSQAQSGSLFGPVAAHPAGALFGAVAATANPGGPFMQFAAGDYGVQRVSSYAINTGATGGTGCIILHRPICTIPLVAANTAGERDFLNQMPTLPRIFDDACLGLFALVGGALTTSTGVVQGELVTGWA
jgi:hypothetical protein